MSQKATQFTAIVEIVHVQMSTNREPVENLKNHDICPKNIIKKITNIRYLSGNASLNKDRKAGTGTRASAFPDLLHRNTSFYHIRYPMRMSGKRNLE
jgi:hypothetical protein